jgi:hypothetical protein
MSNIPGFDEAILGFRTYYRCAVDPTFDCPLELATADALPEIEPLVDSPASDKYGRSIRSLIRLRRDRLEIGRALVEINAANWQSLLPYYTDDYEYHDPIVDIYGFDTLVPFFARLFASSPDLVTTVEDEMLIGGVYTATWTMVGSSTACPTAPRVCRSSSSVPGAHRRTTRGTTTASPTSWRPSPGSTRRWRDSGSPTSVSWTRPSTVPSRRPKHSKLTASRSQ